MSSSTGSRSFCASSGSRSASNSIEPLISANSTVICFRSPSRAVLEVRILSARCWDVYLLGEANRGSSLMGLRGWPHWGQNLAVSHTWLPQLSQVRGSGAAHSSQNFALALFSCWHCWHFIAGPEGRSEPDVLRG